MNLMTLKRNPAGGAERLGRGARPCAGGSGIGRNDAGAKALLRADAGGRLRSDDAAGLERSSRITRSCESLGAGDFIELTGEFHQHQQFGLEARNWKVRPLNDAGTSELLAGPGGIARETIGRLGIHLSKRSKRIRDPRLALVRRNISERMGRSLSPHGRRRAIIIMRGEADSSSTPRR